MTLLEEVVAKTEALGLPVDRLDRITVPVGNGITQFQVAESRAGRLVRQLEDHYRIHPERRSGTLGERFKRIPA